MSQRVITPRRRIKIQRKMREKTRERKRFSPSGRAILSLFSMRKMSGSTMTVRGAVKKLNKKRTIMRVRTAGVRMTSPVRRYFFIEISLDEVGRRRKRQYIGSHLPCAYRGR